MSDEARALKFELLARLEAAEGLLAIACGAARDVCEQRISNAIGMSRFEVVDLIREIRGELA